MNNKALWVFALAGWFLALGLFFITWRAVDRLAPGGQPEAASKSVHTAICPVSQNSVVVDDQTPHVVYKNHDYWFCERTENGKSHKTLFLMDPEKYVSGHGLPAEDLEPEAGSKPAPRPAQAPTAPSVVQRASPQPSVNTPLPGH